MKEKIKGNFSSPIFKIVFGFSIVVLISCFVLSLFINLFIIEDTDFLEYKENVNAKYVVKLKPNDYYPTSTLGSGMNYISSLINKINITYNYNFYSNKQVDYNSSYYISATLRVYEDGNKSKVLYEKSEILANEKKLNKNQIQSVPFTENISIDYDYYNNYISQFISTYGLNRSSDLTVVMHIKTNGSNKEFSDKINSTSTSSVVIPLASSIIGVTTNDSTDDDAKFLLNKMDDLGFSNMNWVSLALFVVLLASDIFVLVKSIKYVFEYYNSFTKYEKTLKKVLRDYDGIIANVNSNVDASDYKFIYVESFEELVDIHDNLGNPILYNEVSKGFKSYFTIIDNDVMYRYVLKNKKENDEEKSNNAE